MAFSYSGTVKDTKRIKKKRETDSQESRDLNKTQASYLFVAALSFLGVISLLFFAATDCKSTLVFSIGAFFCPDWCCLGLSVRERKKGSPMVV